MRCIKVVLIIVFSVLISACRASTGGDNVISSQSSDIPSRNEIKADQDDVKATQKKASWLLNGQEGVEDRVQFLTNLDDPTGRTNIRIDDLIDTMQTREERIKYHGSQVYVGKITSDGSRMAIIRDVYGEQPEELLIIEVYDLDAGEKEREFKLPPTAQYPVISSDLSKYLYVMDGRLYLYDAISKRTTELKTNKGKADVSNIAQGVFSPDNTKLCFVDDQTGIVMLDLSGDSGTKLLLAGTDVSSIMQWDQGNRLIYTTYKKDNTFINDIYSLDIYTGKVQFITKNEGEFILSPDQKKLVLADDEVVKMFMIDVASGKKEDITSIVNGEGTWVIPIQWIETKTNYMKYSNKVKVKKITASSTLPNQNNYSFNVNNLTDDNNLTPWCEGTKEGGVGETVTMDLGPTQEVRGMEMVDGIIRVNNKYLNVNTIQKMKLDFSDGQSVVLENNDTRFKFDEPIRTSFVKITILEVKKGTDFPNTCIGELKLL
ncbi:discoidin domain-containing protein [Paenibacillus sp. S25]|uniref:NADase-type glycan-binding domain-containing protein n=1 Tax=Paenibacillus sp. S25 TaxID=2823905 RepID=UPI001C65407F|nr:discoidin domain-containing protein [Paenibacillus sp. S25]QYK64573.1 Tol-Pal system protein TolB [Paenibacillus sp. S25]